jgi:hypothetical protein
MIRQKARSSQCKAAPIFCGGMLAFFGILLSFSRRQKEKWCVAAVLSLPNMKLFTIIIFDAGLTSIAEEGNSLLERLQALLEIVSGVLLNTMELWMEIKWKRI